MDFYKPDQSHSRGMASDRLQKAIERNRAKQAKRGGFDRNLPEAPDFFKPSEFKPRTSSVASISRPVRPLPSTSTTTAAPLQARASRTSVARPNDFKFEGGLDHVPKRSSSQLKKVSALEKTRLSIKVEKYLVLAGWCFCLFLFLRLVFAENGVMDYYSRKSALDRKERELHELSLQNNALSEEIMKIKNSPSYQKTLVRDLLGFIAGDEFLVLFDKES